MLAVRELNDLLENAKRLSDSEFASYVVDAYPRLTDPYVEMAGQMAANWFEESDPKGSYVAKTADPIPQEKLEKSARWALASLDAPNIESRLAGTLHRAVFDGARNTTLLNVSVTGSRWMRQARPDACAFCRMLATRSTSTDDLYRSEDAALNVVGRSFDLTLSDRRHVAAGLTSREAALSRRETYARGTRAGQSRVRAQRGNRKLGSKGYHDDCQCIAVEVFPGAMMPELPAYVDDWERVYLKARRDAGSADPSRILSAWRQIDGSA